MSTEKKHLTDYSIEELSREIIRRGTIKIPCGDRLILTDKPNDERVMSFKVRLESLDEIEDIQFHNFKGIDTRSLLAESMMRIKSVFGTNNCTDFNQITDNKVKARTQSVAAIITTRSLDYNGKGYSSLKTKSFKKYFSLCDSERFVDQPIIDGGIVTGFLIKEDVIVTAGHFTSALNTGNPDDLYIVFGYKTQDVQIPITNISNSDIYKAKKIMKAKNRTLDYAFIKLDRPVDATRQTVAALSNEPISHNQPVYAIGYPFGLPSKYIPGGYVKDIGNPSFFYTDLDVSLNNSGSPVFNSNNEVVGIVVEVSDKEFEINAIPCKDEKCWIIIVYSSDDESQYSKCTRVSSFIDHVNEL